MSVLPSYIGGRFVAGAGEGSTLVNPTTEAVLAHVSSDGLDLARALGFARDRGGAALSEATFAERGKWLAAMASQIHTQRDELIALSIENGGNTRSDAKFDIDGATSALTHYADLGASLGAMRHIADGEAFTLARSPRWVGAHLWQARKGVALHIGAFNFPAWNAMEKAAAAIMAGMPVLTKPAPQTALVLHRIVEGLVQAKVLPEGVLSLVCGDGHSLLDHVGPQDVIAFTGSASTGAKLRAHANALRSGARLNVEADSLNAAVLGPDVETGSDTYEMFLRDVAREVTQKAGQKCTAVRRVLVCKERMKDVEADLAERLREVVYGNPASLNVKMGPVTNARQRQAIIQGISAIAGRVACGGTRGEPIDVESGRGFFIAPTLLVLDDANADSLVHTHEVFGPVATLMPFGGDARDAGATIRKSEGTLVTSVYSDDETFAGEMLHEVGATSGRMYFGSAKVSDHAAGPGAVLPGLIHGGPGRAGGGEELGGLRGLFLYMQRSALQGYKPMIERFTVGDASKEIRHG
jgi:3,4-dehydroadipyl-CoA semialdehyde dehydrogenase